QAPGYLLVLSRSKQAILFWRPAIARHIGGGRDSQQTPPRSHSSRVASELGRDLAVGRRAEQFLLLTCPNPGDQMVFAEAKTDAPQLALSDDFLDGAAEAAGKDGIGDFAKQCSFGLLPRSAATGFSRRGHRLNQGCSSIL